MTSSKEKYVLDIGPHGQWSLKELCGFYVPSEKATPTGMRYSTYAGYYYYLITGSKDNRLLRVVSEEELEIKNDLNWVNVEGLEDILYANLVSNMMTKPLARKLIPANAKAVWHEPGRSLKAAERRWLDVVNRWLANN